MSSRLRQNQIFVLLLIISLYLVFPSLAKENNSSIIDQEYVHNWAEPPDDLSERFSIDPKDEGIPGVKYVNISKYRSEGLPYKQISTEKSHYLIKFEYSGEINEHPPRIEYPEININSTYVRMVANQSNQINQNSSKNLPIEWILCPVFEHIHFRKNMSTSII